MLEFSNALQTQMGQDIITLSGVTPILNLYTGTLPITCETTSTDNVVATFALPTPFLLSANGVVALTGTWHTTCIFAGLAGYFRLLNSATCILQGAVGYSVQAQWTANTAYQAGNVVESNFNAYTCNITGVSGSLGINGTGQNIIDGTCSWNYLGPVGDLNFINPNFTLNESITINQFNITFTNGS